MVRYFFGKMRIIAGQHKGRSLLSPREGVTRPITSRVKTALFSILADAVTDVVVADLFCGTGSLGLEALSRGARYCYFADRDRTALARLKRNIEAMDLAGRCRVWQGDIMRDLRRRLGQVRDSIGLAFVDPPYSLVEGWRWDEAVEKLFAPLAAKLADDGLVVLRCRRNTTLPDTLGPLYVHQKRDYGKMTLVFLTQSDKSEYRNPHGTVGPKSETNSKF